MGLEFKRWCYFLLIPAEILFGILLVQEFFCSLDLLVE